MQEHKSFLIKDLLGDILESNEGKNSQNNLLNFVRTSPVSSQIKVITYCIY